MRQAKKEEKEKKTEKTYFGESANTKLDFLEEIIQNIKNYNEPILRCIM